MPLVRAAWMLLGAVLLFCCCCRGSVLELGDDDFDEFVGKLPDEALLLVDFFKV